MFPKLITPAFAITTSKRPNFSHAFANKFLSGKDLERVKEELKVTELGKSLIDEGKKEKAIEIAKKAILKGMDNETIQELTDLSIEDIELIRKVMN